MKETLKRIGIFFSCVYTLVTILSSIVNMILGQTQDSYLHLLDRAVVIMIPILFYYIVKAININIYVKLLIHYIATVVLTMIETFLIGVITNDLAPTAYTDQLLNYSIVYVIVLIGLVIRKRKSKR